jgi:archaellum biogenesis ATPase FlaH
MSERRLLAAVMQDRTAYDTVIDRLEPDDLTEQGNILMENIVTYYRADGDAKRVDPATLSEAVQATLTNPKHHKVFSSLIEDIASEEVSAGNVVRLFCDQKRDVVGSRLASAIVAGKHKDVPPLLEEYEGWVTSNGIDNDTRDEDLVLNGCDLSQLVQDNFDEDSLIKVAPKALNDRLDGGVLRGHHIVVFARPEMGKTLLVCNMAYGFLQQGLRVLYIGNEEPIQDTYLRMVCRLAGWSKHDVVARPKEAEDIANGRGANLLFMSSMSPGTLKQIENLTVKVQADVLIVDQLRNIQVKNENFTQALEQAAKGIRQIGKRTNCVTVSVTQAGDSAQGRAVLDMGDIDSSNTGIPAQADVLVGLGANPQDLDMGRRIISLPKNKRAGNHDNFPIQVDLNTSTIRSIV